MVNHQIGSGRYGLLADPTKARIVRRGDLCFQFLNAFS